MKASPLLAAGFLITMATFVEPAAAANEEITGAGTTPPVKADVAVVAQRKYGVTFPRLVCGIQVQRWKCV